MAYSELSDEQRRVLIDTLQSYEALMEARERAKHYLGFMSWKRAKGKEYLFKGKGGRGTGKSLGPRSPETEAKYNAFYKGKEQATLRVKALEERVGLQAKYALANGLNRVPREATNVLRALAKHDTHFRVAGSNALYAYESAAGVHLQRDVVATRDFDILLDTRHQLLISSKLISPRFIDVLQMADKSYQVKRNQSFRAINSTGYMVDLITPAPRQILHHNPFAQTASDDLDIVEIEKLEWLINAPVFEQLAIGYDGVPVTMPVPDPRAFVLHKFFVSQQTNRDPIKKQRDREQAFVVANILHYYLPQYRFSDSWLRVFPTELRNACQQRLINPAQNEEPHLW